MLAVRQSSPAQSSSPPPAVFCGEQQQQQQQQQEDLVHGRVWRVWRVRLSLGWCFVACDRWRVLPKKPLK